MIWECKPGERMPANNPDGFQGLRVEGIIRALDSGYDIHVQPGCTPICCIHSLLDDPPVRRWRTRNVEGCRSFRDGLADLPRRVGSAAVVPSGWRPIYVRAPLCAAAAWRPSLPALCFA